MRLAPSLAAMLLIATCAAAQPAPDAGTGATPPSAPQGAAPGSPPPHRGGPGFEAANVTHDGRLTREQAQQGGMRQVARHFDEVDADRKGYVTKQDIRAWRQARRAAKQGQAGPQGQPGGYPPPDAPGGPPAGSEQPGPPPQ